LNFHRREDLESRIFVILTELLQLLKENKKISVITMNHLKTAVAHISETSCTINIPNIMSQLPSWGFQINFRCFRIGSS